MRIATGSTRLVLLIGNKAIKLGRIRPALLCFRILLLPFSKGRRERFAEKYHPDFKTAAWLYLVAGPIANRREYCYYQEFRDTLVAPTTALLLGGLLSIQERGEPVSKQDLLDYPPLMNCGAVLEGNKPKQFCRLKDGRIVLVDYGSQLTMSILVSLQQKNSVLFAAE